MVIVSVVPHAEFVPNDHREDAVHFIFEKPTYNSFLWKSFQSGNFMASSYDFFDVFIPSEILKFMLMKSKNKIFILCYSVSK